MPPCIVNIRPLTCATDSVIVCKPNAGATVASVGASVTSITILPANIARKGALFFNDSSSTAIVKFGATASASSYSLKIPSQTFYELSNGYTGVVDSIWALANGSIKVTEFI